MSADQKQPSSWRKQVRRLRLRARRNARSLGKHKPLVAAIERILFEADPLGLDCEGNPDEYRPEAKDIAIALCDRGEHVQDAGDVTRVVHETFIRWFGLDMAGNRSRFAHVGDQVHEAWRALPTT